ncbi:MAG: hypothetical protein QOH04_2977 [Sphingomonadales bacterium]|nr:hypothetical protein [Sphingomonadales bacterium]
MSTPKWERPKSQVAARNPGGFTRAEGKRRPAGKGPPTLKPAAHCCPKATGGPAGAAAVARLRFLFQRFPRLSPGEDPLPAAQRPSRLFAFVAALLVALLAVPAAAAVQVTFYSKELGATFPHAFVTLAGTLDRSGQRIDVDYGFTAKTVSPAILFGRVAGEVISDHGAAYIKASDKHFSLALSDAEYDRLMATVARWRGTPQPSYDLGTHNCIHFVADLAASLGMKADVPKKLTRKPRSYLDYLTDGNRPWLVAHNAVFYRREAKP